MRPILGIGVLTIGSVSTAGLLQERMMKSAKITVLLAIFVVLAIFGLERRGMAQAASNLRIISPQNGQKLSTNFVAVRYQLINPAIASSPTPTFQLQLDGGDPIRTATTDYTFTGLAPGKHTVVVELVDANNTPISGSVNAVQFVVLAGAPPPAQSPSSMQMTGPADGEPKVEDAALQQEAVQQEPTRHETARQEATSQQPQSAPADDPALPNTSSALPLLSVIGFGVLLGGIASAMKTR